jgi:hypothetical protein
MGSCEYAVTARLVWWHEQSAQCRLSHHSPYDGKSSRTSQTFCLGADMAIKDRITNTELVANGGTSRADIFGKDAWVYEVTVEAKKLFKRVP